ncbi:MAG: M42 family metallopeptidase [Erysipelotrichaceae bacterium]|nr:M42 family metallopeptidase [Erysipelotrichaceae bacterium]
MENRKEAFFEFAKELFAIDSPTGYTHHAIAWLKEKAENMGYKTWINAKGNLYVEVEGEDNTNTKGLCAHVDTLGLMVRSIKSDGKLSFTVLGGPLLPTYDGEYCRVYTREGKVYTGTILSTSPSVHVYPDARSSSRECEHMEVRLDEVVKTAEDTKKLGIMNGDFIALDPKTTVTESGFIKSRFLDDKISVACLFQVLKELKEKNLKPKHRTLVMITVYEEVGHGNSWIPSDVNELLAVDMGCIGLDLACSEYDVSICAKDSSGPYDYHMTSELISIAKQKNLNYAVDIYPMYGSDVSAALRGGHDIKGALIGPGVHASHGMERTHYDGLNATIELILGYLL